MHDDMQYDPIQGQGHEPLKVGFDPARFLIFVLVFVSRDFELGRNVNCEESPVSPVRGYFLHFSTILVLVKCACCTAEMCVCKA